MKILWFANTPCGATEKLTGNKVTGGSWLTALSDAIKGQPSIELHIAFYWPYKIDPFSHSGIYYYPIYRRGGDSVLGRYFYRLKQQFSKDLDNKEIMLCETLINNVQPNLIHFHGSEENFGLIAEKVTNIPMVLSIQGLLSPCFYKLYSGFQRSEVLQRDKVFSTLMQDGFAAKERVFKKKAIREQKILKNIENIIGRTSWDRDCSLSLNPQRKYFVCNEILRPQFLQEKWCGFLEKKIILVTTISYGLYKGLEVIFETARILKNQNIDFEWYVIGVSSGDKYETITRKITKINPEEINIRFCGRRSATDMIDIFNHCNVFVQVSHIENSPNSLCEAMALGMPIIASYAGGTDSMLTNDVDGVLLQDGDPYRLAGAVINMKNNYSNAIKMAENARNKALLRHNPNNVVAELMSIYNNLCNK